MANLSVAAKALMPNQCIPLHLIYGAHDCCLCNSRQALENLQKEYDELSRKVTVLEAQLRDKIPVSEISFKHKPYEL